MLMILEDRELLIINGGGTILGTSGGSQQLLIGGCKIGIARQH